MKPPQLSTAIVLLFPLIVHAQTTIEGKDLALRSSGAETDAGWTLDQNGYVGTYLTLAAPASVTLTVEASGQSAGGDPPQMGIVVNDDKTIIDVAETDNQRAVTLDLPEGTHFVRVEFINNQLDPARTLSIKSLTIDGAEAANENTDENALAAADTYIEQFRKSDAVVRIEGVEPGTPVDVKLTRHAFNFGAAFGGTTIRGVTEFLTNPQFADYLTSHFNLLVASNAGKWAYNEGSPGEVTMEGVDYVNDFAEQNNMRVRMHTLIWDTGQEPRWVQDLIEQAAAGSTDAKRQLREAISRRIGYYVRDRAPRFVEMDVINEPFHRTRYWEIFGPQGIAEIFTETAEAIDEAGADTTTFINEYNVLQHSSDPLVEGAERDDYSNWYRRYVEQIVQAGGRITGVGFQYYVFDSGGDPHAAAQLQQIFQNLSVTGLDLTLTEFGVQTRGDTTIEQAADYLGDTLRMCFGTPQMKTFIVWGIWTQDVWDQAPLGALIDDDYQLTPAGEVYEDLIRRWDTALTTTVQPDATIRFRGFYGDYDLTINGQTHHLLLEKGKSDYGVVVTGAESSPGEVEPE